MAQEQATMQLPMDLIAPAIQAHVNSAVIEALKGSDALILKLVSQIMNQQVSSEGKPDGYGNQQPWISWAVQGIVRDAIKESIKTHLADNEAKIKSVIDAEMKKSNSRLVKGLVEGMTKGIAEHFADSYRINISFTP